MLSRGKLLGEILDGLSQLSFTLQTRGKFGLFDLNLYCEDFAKQLLNIVYDYDLINLNSERRNEPGIDLGDEQKRIAFQITTNKTSAKVKETLEKLTDEQKVKYDKFKIFILGSKQGSYSIPDELKNPVNFNEKEDIMDFQDIESKILSLPVEKIRDVYNFLEQNLIKVYGDLGFDETPDGESTSILPFLEQKSVYEFSNCNLLIPYAERDSGEEYTEEVKEEFNDSFKRFANLLMSLPKITREFFYSLVYKAEEPNMDGDFELDDELLRRFLHISTRRYNEELRILQSKALISYEQIEDYHNIITTGAPAADNLVLKYIKEASDNGEINLKAILVDLHFSLLEV